MMLLSGVLQRLYLLILSPDETAVQEQESRPQGQGKDPTLFITHQQHMSLASYRRASERSHTGHMGGSCSPYRAALQRLCTHEDTLYQLCLSTLQDVPLNLSGSS